MGVLDSMKQRLGLGGGDNYGDYDYDDGYDDGRYDDGYQDDYDDEYVEAVPRTRSSATISLVDRDENLSYSRTARPAPQFSAAGVGEPSFMRNRGEYGDSSSSMRDRAASLARGSQAGYGEPVFGSSPTEARRDSYGARAEEYPRSTTTSVEARPRATQRDYDPYADYSSTSVEAVPRSAPIKTVTPYSYDDAKDIVDSFKNRYDVVVVLRDIKPELAKRILDFSFGATYAMEGVVDKVADRVFLLSHTGNPLTPEQRAQLSAEGVL